MYNPGISAYQKVEKNTLSGRQMEAHILTKASHALKACQDDWDAENREARLNAALKLNQQIWSIFQTELAKKDNPLPKKLRIDLLRLSAFVDKRIFEMLSMPRSEKLTALININNNIAAGLQKTPTSSILD